MKFKTIFNEEINVECAGCVVMDNSKFVEGRIFQTKLWDLSHDYEIPYPGMIVVSPMRHVSNYMDLSKEELDELHKFFVLIKKATLEIYNSTKMANIWYEKENGHVHFVFIPLHGLVEIKDKYSVLGELITKTPELLKDANNMQMVVDGIAKFKKYFSDNGS